MILLDTNVLSETLRPNPEEKVIRWIIVRPRNELYTTAVTQAEILAGAAVLPDGPRRRNLEAAVRTIFQNSFTGRILPFDSAAAEAYAHIAVVRRRAGRPISQFDAEIAAIALSRGAALATRNVHDFEGCGVEVVNPWD